MKITEGYMPFKGYQTYYRIVGECKEGKKPLILMHGGPGSTHNYFEVLDKLAEDGRALIMYDQLGCGNSYVENRPDLWTQETWMEELIALREHLGLKEVHLLGQSWGGMLEIAYMCDEKPEGVKSLIISSGHPSSKLWAEEQHRMIRFMPKEMQDAIAHAEETGNYEGEAYQRANEEFMLRHCAGVPDPDGPECLTREKKSGSESYMTAWGPNEFAPLGNLRDFEYRDRLGEIDVPTLVISGIDDLCTPVVAKTMYDGIPGAKWELFRHSRHACFVEETEKYIELVRGWMNEHDMIRLRKIVEGKRDYMPLLLLADEQEDMVLRYLDRGELFAAYENEELVGVCVVTKEPKYGEEAYEVKNLAVAEHLQRHGYGRSILKQIEEMYRGRCSELYVGTGDSPLTVPFYKKCGFTESHRVKDFFTEHYDHPIVEGGVILRDMVYFRKKI